MEVHELRLSLLKEIKSLQEKYSKFEMAKLLANMVYNFTAEFLVGTKDASQDKFNKFFDEWVDIIYQRIKETEEEVSLRLSADAWNARYNKTGVNDE